MSLRRVIGDRQPHQMIALFAGVVFGFVVSVLAFSSDNYDRWFDDNTLMPEWAGLVVGPMVLASGLLVAKRRRSRGIAVVTLSLVPLMVGGTARRMIDPHPAWADVLRVIGFCLVITVAFVVAGRLGGRLKELEGLVFHEASSLAFLMTVSVTALYGIAEGFLDAPHLSYLWLPVVAIVCWLIAFIVRGSRFS